MFDFDAGKLIVIAIVALIAIPSKDLPRVLMQLGRWLGQLRRMGAEFQGQLMEAMREAELDHLKKEVDSAMAALPTGAFDPLAEARKQVTEAIEAPVAPAASQPPAAIEPPAGAHSPATEAIDAPVASEPQAQIEPPADAAAPKADEPAPKADPA